MPSRLRWAYATKADVGDIMAFTCCRSVRKTPPFGSWRHPEPWASKAQSLIRNCKPCRDPEYLLVGRDRVSGALSAVARWSETSDYTGANVKVAGVSLSTQGKGLGKETLEEVFGEIAGRALTHKVEVVHIVCEVHPQNGASLGLLTRMGFNYHGLRRDHQIWALDLLLAGTEPLIFDPE